MKALVCRELGPPESLRVEEVAALRDPGPGEVKLAVHACGVNFADTLVIEGKYQEKPAMPFSPGMECAGVVLAAGAGVSLVPGTRVMAVTGTGGMAEEAIASANRVFPIPDAMSFAQAAAFPVAYGTAYYALVDRGRLRAGETLLVLGAAGGVGSVAVEMGKVLGAKVIAAAGGAAKAEAARQLGADHAFDYSAQGVKDAVKALAPAGVDVVFDPVGGDAFDQALRAVAPEARVLVIGFASGRIPSIAANLLLVKNVDVVGIYWGGFTRADPARNRANFETMLGWIASGKLKPPVVSVFELARAGEAMRALLSRASTGKLVIATRA